MKRKARLLGTALLIGIMTGCDSTSVESPDTTTDTIAPVTTEVVTKKVEPSGWYMRTVVSAVSEDGTVYSHNTAGVFGELDESTDGLDRHDVPSSGSAIIQVRFINDQFDEGEEYYSDYREYNASSSKKQTWTFLVVNEIEEDLSSARLQIGVEALKNVYRKSDNTYYETTSTDQSKRDSLVLIDLDNNRTYKYEELKNADLSMDGKNTRQFRWVLNGEVDTLDTTPVNLTKYQQPFKKKIYTSSTDKFGLPPQ